MDLLCLQGGHLAQLGLTFWMPLNSSSSASQCLDDVEYKPHIKLNNLLELYKYFPRLNVAAPAPPSTTNRRSSHMPITLSGGSSSASSSSSSCETDRAAAVRQQQNYAEDAYQRQWAYRRGGSLPAMDCSNSETENSCDSFI